MREVAENGPGSQWIASTVVLAATMAPTAVRAEPSHFEMRWSAPASCPAAGDVRREVDRILHGNAELSAHAQLRVAAEVHAPVPADPDARWEVVIAVETGARRSERRLQASTCDEVASATALLVAMLIDPRAVESTPQAAPSPTEANAVIAVPTTTRDTDLPSGRAAPSTAAAARGYPVRFQAGVLVAALGGYLPQLSPGVALFAGAGWRWLEGDVHAHAWLPSRTTADAFANGAEFRALSAGARGCVAVPWGAFVVGPCAGADLTNLRGNGFGANVMPAASSDTFWSVTTGVSARWRAGARWQFPLSFELLWPAGTPAFAFGGTSPGPVFQPHSPATRLAIGAELRLE